MIITGEKINSSRPEVQRAIADRNVDFIQALAASQAKAGCDYIDVNAGTLLGEEPEALEWLVRTVQSAVPGPLCLDSPNPKAIERALRAHRGQAIVNSITAESLRFDDFIPLITEFHCSVIALCMDDDGVPEDAAGRAAIAGRLADRLLLAGVPAGDIFFDPMIRPLSTGDCNAMIALETMGLVSAAHPDSHLICGLSNVSYGLPERSLLNRVFLAMAVQRGLDSVIMDPEDKKLRATLLAAEALAGRDEYCLNYISASREGRLE